MYLTRNIVARSRNQYCRGIAINITYSECVSVALVIQLAKRMHHIILSSVACLVLPFFPTLSLSLTHTHTHIKRKDLQIK